MLTRRLAKLLARQVRPSKRSCRPAAGGRGFCLGRQASPALPSPRAADARAALYQVPDYAAPPSDNGLDSNNLTTRQIVRFVKRGQVRFEIIGSFRR
jgi:hypothetical protein